MKDKIEKILHSDTAVELDKFYNSPWYIACVAFVCVMSYMTGFSALAIALLAALVIPALIVCKNSFVLIPFLLMFALCMSPATVGPEYFLRPMTISVLCVTAVVAIPAFVFHIAYYGKWRIMFKRSYLTVSFAVLTGLTVIGGIGAPSLSWIGVGLALAIGASMFLPYSLFFNCGEYKGRKTIEFFAYTMIAVAVVIFSHVIKQYVSNGLNLDYHPKNLIEFGYAISNTAAAIVVLAIPMTFYLVHIYKYGFLFLPVVALELLTVAMTFSRAALLIAIPGTLIVAIAMCFTKKTGRLGYWITVGIGAAAAVALVVVARHRLSDMIESFFSGTGSGRTNLWKSGFEAFKAHPVFGLGIWYLPPINDWYYSFHCTPLTYLYCTGVFGLGAYLYHRYRTVRLVFSAKLTKERVFLALTVLAMLCNALLDIAMTSPLHLLYYGTMLALINCDVKVNKKTVPVAVAAAGVAALYDDNSAKRRTDGRQ